MLAQLAPSWHLPCDSFFWNATAMLLACYDFIAESAEDEVHARQSRAEMCCSRLGVIELRNQSLQ
jgi:hypothetical protein